ncbi:MAG: hypothetical protein D6704_11485 [Nitrospirae bacterium]|nr:MAG: hypothetical protein D6704_11485 [Nitrospirota bacterium]
MILKILRVMKWSLFRPYALIAGTVAAIILPACSHWRDAYLDDHLHTATQDEIRQKFGDPWQTKTSLLTGETTWIYRYVLTTSELDPTGLRSLGKGIGAVSNAAQSILGGRSSDATVADKPICVHYVLVFDKTQVLQDWKRVACTDTST